MTQDFNALWVQTAATIVSHPSANVTATQNFDGDWRQIDADVLTVSGDQSTDQTFDADWAITGGIVTTQTGPNTETIALYNAQSVLQSTTTEAIIQAHAGPEVFASTPGTPTVFEFDPGQINGDAFARFVTAQSDPTSHDVLEFIGYGPGAHLTQIDSTHWEVVSQFDPPEVFILAGALNPAAGDVVFRS